MRYTPRCLSTQCNVIHFFQRAKPFLPMVKLQNSGVMARSENEKFALQNHSFRFSANVSINLFETLYLALTQTLEIGIEVPFNAGSKKVKPYDVRKGHRENHGIGKIDHGAEIHS